MNFKVISEIGQVYFMKKEEFLRRVKCDLNDPNTQIDLEQRQ